MAALSGSYKEKMMRVVDLLNQRTREAEAWKKTADTRLKHLASLSAHVMDVEAALQDAEIVQWLGVPALAPQMTLITDGASVVAGIEAAEEVRDSVTHLLKRLTTSAHDATETLERALAAGDRPDLAISPVESGDDDDSSGLTLTEIGAYDNPALFEQEIVTLSPSDILTDVASVKEKRSRHPEEKKKSSSSKHKSSSK